MSINHKSANTTSDSIEKWFLRPNPAQNKRFRLFCIPHAGGGAAFFHRWQKELPGTVDLCTVRLPGRERRLSEEAFTDLNALVMELVRQINPLLDLPFVIFGHSMGAMIAFELTRYFRNHGIPLPNRLYVSGYRPPHLPRRDPDISHLSDEQFLQRIRDFNGLPNEVLDEPELCRFFLPILRADTIMLENYHYQEEEPLPCPISSFGGLSDPKVSSEDVDAWKLHTSNEFEIHMLPGDHFYLADFNGFIVETILSQNQRLIG